MGNIVSAVFRDGRGNTVYTKDLFQHDHGLILRISGIPLPESYQVHFSNDEKDGISISKTVSGSDVAIPDVFLETGKYVYAWIYLTESSESVEQAGNSEYRIVMPVVQRPAIFHATGGGEPGQLAADLDEESHALYFRWR